MTLFILINTYNKVSTIINIWRSEMYGQEFICSHVKLTIIDNSCIVTTYKPGRTAFNLLKEHLETTISECPVALYVHIEFHSIYSLSIHSFDIVCI